METIAVLASRRQVAARSYRADRGKNHDPVGRRAVQKTAAEYHPRLCPGGQTGTSRARAAPSLVRALRDARGALLFATGTKPDPTPPRCPFLQVDRRPGRRNVTLRRGPSCDL